MIAPENRLLFYTAVVAVPSAALATAVPAGAPVALSLIAAFFLVAVCDAFSGIRKAKRFSAKLPDLARLFRSREGSIEIGVRNDSEKSETVKIGIAFPAMVEPSDSTLVARLPEGVRDSFFSMPVKPKSHGCFFVQAVFIQISSPLGLWSVRQQCPSPCEIRVYPDLSGERKNLAALFSRKGTGVHPVRQMGKGREFEQLRDYLPGDVYEDIYWKATARRNRPVTRIFQVERTQEIYVVLDSSRLSSRVCRDSGDADAGSNGSAGRRTTILDRFVTASMVLGLAAQNQGDLFGLVKFSDQVDGFIRAGAGKVHYNACWDSLYTLYPTPKAANLEEVFAFIATKLRRRALLIFLTNLDDPAFAESFVRCVDIIGRKHLIVAGMIKTEPVRPLFSRKDATEASELYGELGAHILWSDLKETEKSLRRKGVWFHLLENEKLCVQLVSHYINVKRKQLL